MKSRRKKSENLQDEQVIKALEEVAERLSVSVHYEEMKAFEFRVQDGSCRLKGKPRIFIDRKRPLKEKITVLARELSKFDLETVYVPPLLRERVLFPSTPRYGTDSDATGQRNTEPL